MGSSGRASISAAGNKNPQAVMYGLNEIIIITLKTYNNHNNIKNIH